MAGKKKLAYNNFPQSSPMSDLTPAVRIVPEVQFSPGLLKGKLRKGKVADAMERFVREFAPQVMPEFTKSLMEGNVKGDLGVMRLTAEILGLVAKGGGVTINNNNSNNNLNSNSGRSFDLIARELEEERNKARGTFEV